MDFYLCKLKWAKKKSSRWLGSEKKNNKTKPQRATKNNTYIKYQGVKQMESMKSAHRIANTSGLYQIQKVDKLLYMSIYVFLFLFFFFYFAGGTERESVY